MLYEYSVSKLDFLGVICFSVKFLMFIINLLCIFTKLVTITIFRFYMEYSKAHLINTSQIQEIKHHDRFFVLLDLSWNDNINNIYTVWSTGCFIITYMGGIVDHSIMVLHPPLQKSQSAPAQHLQESTYVKSPCGFSCLPPPVWSGDRMLVKAQEKQFNLPNGSFNQLSVGQLNFLSLEIYCH